MAPFYGWNPICHKARDASRRQFTSTTKFPEIPGTHFKQPQKDKRLSRPWSHPVVLNTGPWIGYPAT